MGAWAHGTFDNDDALDWVGELEGAEDDVPIREAFAAVLEAEDDFIEAPDASRALAAAEVVAALRGNSPVKLPDQVTAWVAGKKPPKKGLVQQAQSVVKRILEASELKDLWTESTETSEWQQEVEALLGRLTQPTPPTQGPSGP